MDCLDCLRIINSARRDRAQRALTDELIKLAAHVRELTADKVVILREQIKLVRPPAEALVRLEIARSVT
ncbi:hypothetical protein GGC64_006307 [Mycobacterium sp. OAS707]|uniref:hypothetical protein n=1 Tax=Mycobacterium sp. OAS707 TaxID=2663822 RepID=UPI001789A0F5|nr:hypothetical protein [Mycobacterium sp. OAS707]MBE1552220.1 hypothetical protein [Mycobacterium sp. OAS707]